MHDEPAPDVEQLAAVVMARHRDGRCRACKTDGCPELDWAAPVMADAEARWLEAARGG
ncbi:hypothetical protein [Verrucosispora sp. TAA-831]|uniref:hypothetical protein n=1 Tax=Verrucosispora sp. TAA-831 TaxID=3422227 RepID=UPI003D6DAB6F